MKIRKNYFCVVEGQQEIIYLKRIAALLTNFPEKVVTFNTKLGDANKLYKGSSLPDYDRACFFDHDFKKVEFERNLDTCIELDLKKKDHKTYHAYSNICFDLWLVLHKEYTTRLVSSADGYVKDVRRLYSLNDNTDIKAEDVMNKIVSQISLDEVRTAVANAQRIRNSKTSSDKKFTAEGHLYYSSPDFSIDIFLNNVLKETGLENTDST